MIAAIVIPLYVIMAIITGRYTAARRRRMGEWGYQGCGKPDEDDYMALAGAAVFWPVALALYFMAAEPKPKKLDRMRAEIAELERELGVEHNALP